MAGRLRNIEFEPIAVEVLSIERTPRVLIRWNIKKTAQRLTQMKFFIDRGESPTEMKPLNEVGLDAYGIYEYVDSTPMMFDLKKVYYYQVRAVEFVGPTPVQTFTSAHSTWSGNLDLVGLYVVEEHLFLERWVAGVPVMIFKKRRDGATCPECWDEILKRVTKSNCTTCYGTGKLNGFYPPIESWMLLDPDPTQAAVADWGRLQPNQTDILYTTYPLLTDDDLIIEMQNDKRWKVVAVSKAEKNRTAMLQRARISAVNPTDIEYKIFVPDDRRRHLICELQERNKLREF
jgi:hypothetical protein